MKRAADDSEEPKALKGALDRLYRAPPGEFTALRKELAQTLRGEGHADLAKRVLATRRPDRAAWALNRRVLDDDALVRSTLAAFDAAAAEQAGGDATKWKRALVAYRERLTALAHAIRDDLAAEDANVDAALLRRLTQTVQAAAADPDDRARLLAGRLEKSIDASDSLAGLGAPAPAESDEPKSERRLRSLPPPPSSRRTLSDREERAHAKREALAEKKRKQQEKEAKEKEREREREEKQRQKERERAIKEARAGLASAQAEEKKVEAELERAQKAVGRARAELARLLDED